MLAEQAHRIREAGQTALLIVTDQESLCGVIGVADQLRPEATATMDALKHLGIRKIVILTGDHERVARSIAATLQANEVRAGLMPDQKVVELRRLAEKLRNGGHSGRRRHVVLMRDDLRALPLAVWISHLARRRVRPNMIFAFSVIAVLVISTFFDLPLWLAVLGHEGSTVIVVFNGLRILWEKSPKYPCASPQSRSVGRIEPER